MREPLMILATGTKRVGKTYQTCHAIEEYIKEKPEINKKARKVLIYDVNQEYTDASFRDNGVSFTAPILAIKDLKKWSMQDRVEVRRIVPKDENGKLLTGDELVDLAETILDNFRGGLLVLEDINTYIIGNSSAKIIGVMCSNAHRDLDIYIHLQSIAAVTTRMFQNAAYIRMHKQSDTLKKYINRIPNPELYQIAEKLVNQKYLYDKRFFCYIQIQLLKLTGKFSLFDYQKACYAYLLENPRMITDAQRRFSGKKEDTKKQAIEFLIKDLYKYFGNPIKRN